MRVLCQKFGRHFLVATGPDPMNPPCVVVDVLTRTIEVCPFGAQSVIKQGDWHHPETEHTIEYLLGLVPAIANVDTSRQPPNSLRIG